MNQFFRPRHGMLAVLILGCSFTFTAAQERSASDPRTSTALRLASADASLFSTSLNLKSRLERIWRTKAIQQAWETPLVQATWNEVLKKWEEQGAPIREALKQKENQELLKLLSDMASDEIFVLCGQNTPRFFHVLLKVAGSLQGQQFGRHLGGNEGPEGLIREILREVRNNKADLVTPDIVLGFKIKDPKAAVRQVARLEMMLNAAAMAVQGMTGKVKHQKLNGYDFGTINLDGAMVPWDKIPWDQIEEENGEFTPLIEHLKKLKLTICIGTYEDYIVIAIGDSTGVVERLGKGKKLAERPELALLEKHLGKPIHGISYVSAALLAGTGQSDLEDMKKTLRDFVEESAQKDDLKKRMNKDIDELAADIQKFSTTPGFASLFVNYGTERGEESFHYQFGRDPSVDFSKPLALLDHAGSTPILAVVGRSIQNPAVWGTFVKWCKKLDYYLHEIEIPFLPEEAKKQMIEILEGLYPVFRKIDLTTRENLIPSLADGQFSFVIDAKLRSKQWVRSMPMAKEPVPLPEPALLLGVSDAGKLQKAMGDYRAAFNEALKVFREHDAPIPEEFEWPAPKVKKEGDATFYYYSFPDELELDGRLTPTGAVGKTVAALTISNEHALRLLSNKPLQLDGGPLAEASRPLGGAVYFKMSALVDAALPWVDYSLELPTVKEQAGKHAPDIRKILGALRIFDQYSSATFLEGTTTVTHGEWVIKDVK